MYGYYSAMNKLIALVLLLAACNNDPYLIDTTDSTDTAYEGARIREPDAGWRSFIREASYAP